MQLAKPGPASAGANEPAAPATSAAKPEPEAAAREAGLLSPAGAPTGEELGAQHGGNKNKKKNRKGIHLSVN